MPDWGIGGPLAILVGKGGLLHGMGAVDHMPLAVVGESGGVPLCFGRSPVFWPSRALSIPSMSLPRTTYPVKRPLLPYQNISMSGLSQLGLRPPTRPRQPRTPLSRVVVSHNQ